ncbi:MAG: DUF882 domain-containing protein [Steroidobacteraceae bacterium]
MRAETDDYCDQTRRRVIAAALAAPAALLAGRATAAIAQGQASGPLPERTLILSNTHTGESMSAQYCTKGQYCPEVLSQLNHLLRDHRSGESAVIDPALFDVLHSLALRADRAPHFEVISGFRSAASNASLRALSSGVARNSLHMQGKAMDVRLVGANCARLRDLATALEAGGVGYYRQSDFVHLDTGRVRVWQG